MAFVDDDAEEELLSKALFVPDLEDEHEEGPGESGQFATAEDYLRSVVREARSFEPVKIGTLLTRVILHLDS